MSVTLILSVNVGKPTTIVHQGKEVLTAIYKQQTDAPVFLSKLNLDGDAQANTVRHGGPNKAVSVYSYNHYPYWEKELGQTLPFGSFGENLTVANLIESEVCIGDIYQIGEAIVQVTQPRPPCHKLAKKFHRSELPVLFQTTGFTGFYLRVLQEGMVSADKPMILLERHAKKITIQFANHVMYHDKMNFEAIHRILEVEELSKSWRITLVERLLGIDNDSNMRLSGEHPSCGLKR